MPRNYDDDDDDRPRRRARRRDEEEDDDGRPQARYSARRDYEDDYDDRPRKRKRKPKRAEQSTMGMVALVIGIASIALAFVPCLGVFAILPGLAGLVVGFIALLGAHKSDGRVASGLPIAGLAVSAAAVIIAAGWLIFFKKVGNEIKEADKQFQAEIAKGEEKHKAEVAKAASDVKSAEPGTAIRVSAFQFYKAYDDDPDTADRLYKNRIIEVTGAINELNFGGEVYTVRLRGGPDQFETVECNFAIDPAVKAQLAQLAHGRTVTIRGKCLGGGSDLEGCILAQ